MVLYSASGQRLAVVEGQVMRFGVALSAMVVLAQLSPTTLYRWSLPLYLAGLAMLVAVEIMGDIGMGAQRWLVIPGVVRFQPSELMKLAMPMMVAAYLHRRPLPPGLKDILVCAVILAVPVVLIAKQPDPSVINLASKEYFKAVHVSDLKSPVITPVFKEVNQGQARVLGMFAKQARGMMARYMITNRVETADGLKSFTEGGYRFQPEQSDDKTWVFTRKQPPKVSK